MERPILRLPRIRSLIRHALPHLIEGTLLPVAVFYAALWLTSVWGALVAALVWSYAVIGYKILKGKRVGGLLVITAVTLTLRTLIAFMSGSVIVYFLQPALAKLLVAGAFLITLRGSEPLIQKLMNDFVPMPGQLLQKPGTRRLFVRLSVMWAIILVIHTVIGLWLLFSHSVATYVAVKTVLNFVVKGVAIAATVWAVRRSIGSQGFRLEFA